MRTLGDGFYSLSENQKILPCHFTEPHYHLKLYSTYPRNYQASEAKGVSESREAIKPPKDLGTDSLRERPPPTSCKPHN